MNIYGYLSTSLPEIAYVVLHQAAPGVAAKEYVATMRELHQRIAGESEGMNAGYRASLREATLREAQSLRGALSEFLATPIRSDNEEVQKIFVESFDRYTESVLAPTRFGCVKSSEGRIEIAHPRRPAEARTARNGKSYLTGLGFRFGKNHGAVFESVFRVEGGANLDILEHLVRDRLGIYSTTHGKHLRETASFIFAAYNVVATWSSPAAPAAGSRTAQAVIWFDKPRVEYEAFRNGLASALEPLASAGAFPAIELWQRKLGLGRGKEFALRFTAPASGGVEETMKRLRELDGPDVVRSALTIDGALLMRESVTE